ncbi:glutaredoxin domain-containing cysteine-rich protein 2 isoform X1 [Nerophis ophidion]|uniref:glutaredoxin domain-containing cysteine-rich protein 2 isoform X1 n=1 Tax=Nerophis ophidion TaxID=159077 RepID=UPI002AE0741F|nr:glutaredoxin domain-containing cysteine-rich protein 2 isoform X1 [Nerophis ophidion]
MDEPQRRKGQRHEAAKPRKVRFKLASSYSGRVLKHVYEDGQELDSPQEKYPHSFKTAPPGHLEMEQLCGFDRPLSEQQGVNAPTGLTAQRINVYRGTGAYKAAAGQNHQTDGDPNSSVLDFGKIIIYTSNLRVIRAPMKKAEMVRHYSAPPVVSEGYTQGRERVSRRRPKALSTQEGEQKQVECSPVCLFSRKQPDASIATARASPRARCVTAASCPCWPTASTSPSASCAARPATLTAWRGASRAEQSRHVWTTARRPLVFGH